MRHDGRRRGRSEGESEVGRTEVGCLTRCFSCAASFRARSATRSAPRCVRCSPRSSAGARDASGGRREAARLYVAPSIGHDRRRAGASAAIVGRGHARSRSASSNATRSSLHRPPSRRRARLHARGDRHAGAVHGGEPDDLRRRPLYPAPAAALPRRRIVSSPIYNTYPRANVMDDGASVANYYERRGHITALSRRVASIETTASSSARRARTEREFVMRVTPDFFATLGVTPALGRAFARGGDDARRDRAVVLSGRIGASSSARRSRASSDSRSASTAPSCTDRRRPAAREFRFLSSQARLFLPLASGTTTTRASARRHWGSSSRMVARPRARTRRSSDAQAQIDARQRDRSSAADPQGGDDGERGLPVGRRSASRAARGGGAADPPAAPGGRRRCCSSIGLVNVGEPAPGARRQPQLRAGGAPRDRRARRHIVAAVLAESAAAERRRHGGRCPVSRQAGVALLGTLGANRLPLGSPRSRSTPPAVIARPRRGAVRLRPRRSARVVARRRCGPRGRRRAARRHARRHAEPRMPADAPRHPRRADRRCRSCCSSARRSSASRCTR